MDNLNKFLNSKETLSTLRNKSISAIKTLGLEIDDINDKSNGNNDAYEITAQRGEITFKILCSSGGDDSSIDFIDFIEYEFKGEVTEMDWILKERLDNILIYNAPLNNYSDVKFLDYLDNNNYISNFLNDDSFIDDFTITSLFEGKLIHSYLSEKYSKMDFLLSMDKKEISLIIEDLTMTLKIDSERIISNYSISIENKDKKLINFVRFSGKSSLEYILKRNVDLIFYLTHEDLEIGLKEHDKLNFKYLKSIIKLEEKLKRKFGKEDSPIEYILNYRNLIDIVHFDLSIKTSHVRFDMRCLFDSFEPNNIKLESSIFGNVEVVDFNTCDDLFNYLNSFIEKI